MSNEFIEPLIKLLQTVGFPIFVAGWFMLRMEKRIDEQNDLLKKISVLLNKGEPL